MADTKHVCVCMPKNGSVGSDVCCVAQSVRGCNNRAANNSKERKRKEERIHEERMTFVVGGASIIPRRMIPVIFYSSLREARGNTLSMLYSECEQNAHERQNRKSNLLFHLINVRTRQLCNTNNKLCISSAIRFALLITPSKTVINFLFGCLDKFTTIYTSLLMCARAIKRQVLGQLTKVITRLGLRKISINSAHSLCA